jgi:hypothetical protein
MIRATLGDSLPGSEAWCHTLARTTTSADIVRRTVQSNRRASGALCRFGTECRVPGQQAHHSRTSRRSCQESKLHNSHSLQSLLSHHQDGGATPRSGLSTRGPCDPPAHVPRPRCV